MQALFFMRHKYVLVALDLSKNKMLIHTHADKSELLHLSEFKKVAAFVPVDSHMQQNLLAIKDFCSSLARGTKLFIISVWRANK
jgi:hypothetical protein